MNHCTSTRRRLRRTVHVRPHARPLPRPTACLSAQRLPLTSVSALPSPAVTEMGRVWTEIGEQHGRADVADHGASLLEIAPLLHRDLHASLNRTNNRTASPGDSCFPHRVEGFGPATAGQMSAVYRGYPEMFFSGALTEEQVDAMYRSGLGLTDCEVGRW
eukprot:6076297-Prymnesium_polylepis.1